SSQRIQNVLANAVRFCSGPCTDYDAECQKRDVSVHPIKLILSFILIVNIMVTGASFSNLSGSWIFEANTNDGLLQAELELLEQNNNLLVTLKIDNHVLSGETATDGEH